MKKILIGMVIVLLAIAVTGCSKEEYTKPEPFGSPNEVLEVERMEIETIEIETIEIETREN